MDWPTLCKEQKTASLLFQTRLRHLYDRRLQLARAAILARLETLRADLQDVPNTSFEHVSEDNVLVLQTTEKKSTTETAAGGQMTLNVPSSVSSIEQAAPVSNSVRIQMHSHLRGERFARAWIAGKQVAHLVSKLKLSLFLADSNRDFSRILQVRQLLASGSLMVEVPIGAKSDGVERNSANVHRSDALRSPNDGIQNTLRNVETDERNTVSVSGIGNANQDLDVLVKRSLISAGSRIPESGHVQLKFNIAGSSQVAVVVQAFFSHEFRSLRFSDDCTISFAGKTEELMAIVHRYLELASARTPIQLADEAESTSFKTIMSGLDNVSQLPSAVLNGTKVLPEYASAEALSRSSHVMRNPETGYHYQENLGATQFQNSTQLGNVHFTSATSTQSKGSTPESLDFCSWPIGFSLFDIGHSAYASAAQIAQAETYANPNSPTVVHYPYRPTIIKSVEKSTRPGMTIKRSLSSSNARSRYSDSSLNMNPRNGSAHSVPQSTHISIETPASLDSNQYGNPTPSQSLLNSTTASAPFFVSTACQKIVVPLILEPTSKLEEYEIDKDGNLNLINPI